MFRVGFGFDVHRFCSGRKLVLGGVLIPWKEGLLGHSDADVLVHALMNALLGAAGLRDIGTYFPDTDPGWEGTSSLTNLLPRVFKMIRDQAFSIGNVDATLILDEPKMSPYIEEMKKNLSGVLEVSPARISIKAGTSEGVLFSERHAGVSAMVVVLLNSLEKNRRENGSGNQSF